MSNIVPFPKFYSKEEMNKMQEEEQIQEAGKRTKRTVVTDDMVLGYDYVICKECNKPIFSALACHLNKHHHMTTKEYQEKFPGYRIKPVIQNKSHYKISKEEFVARGLFDKKETDHTKYHRTAKTADTVKPAEAIPTVVPSNVIGKPSIEDRFNNLKTRMDRIKKRYMDSLEILEYLMQEMENTFASIFKEDGTEN